MRILLLGKDGMLGSCFVKSLKDIKNIDLEACGRNEVDLLNEGELEAAFKRVVPDFVINCSAFTAVDACEELENEKMVMAINANAVGRLARLSKENGSVLIHFSTDYVFDGEKKDGYTEDAIPSPINTYGHSKLAGENLIRELCDWHYIIRTSWLFGENGKNFVDTMIDLSKTKSEINVVNDQIGSPTFVNDLCEAVLENFLKVKQNFGIYHLTNSGSCSWYEFALEVFRLKNIEINVNPVSSNEFKRPAVRPKYSILLNTKLKPLRDWKLALKDYLVHGQIN